MGAENVKLFLREPLGREGIGSGVRIRPESPADCFPISAIGLVPLNGVAGLKSLHLDGLFDDGSALFQVREGSIRHGLNNEVSEYRSRKIADLLSASPSNVKPKFMCPFPFGTLIAALMRRGLQQQRCDLDKTFKSFFLQHIDLFLYLFKPELIGVGVDRIKVLLGLILACTFGCSSGEQNNTGQKPGDTNAHNSLTVTVENKTAAITPDLTSYPAGTSMTIEITPDDGDVFYAWSGDPSGTENPLVVTMDGIITVGAVCTSAIYINTEGFF